MLKSFVFLPAIILAASVPALAAPEQAQSAQSQQQPKQVDSQTALDPNRKICKSEDLIGSRTGGSRICKTAAQWAAERKQNGGEDD